METGSVSEGGAPLGEPDAPFGEQSTPPVGERSTQPLSVGGVLSAAFRLYRSQATNLWTLVALIVVPVQIVLWIIVRVSLSSNAYAHDGTIYTSSSTVAVPEISIAVLGFLAAVIAIGALSKCLVDAYMGTPTDWRASFAFAWERLGPLLWLAIVTGVLVAIGVVAFIVPGLYMVVAFSVSVPVLMFERLSPVAALRRSQQLVSGRWWATFGALLVGVVLVVAVGIVVGAVIGAIASSGSVDVVLALSGLSRAISAILLYPLIAAIAAVIYIDLRHRKEGLQVHEIIHGPELTSQSPPFEPPPTN